jgi:hypothetical protein
MNSDGALLPKPVTLLVLNRGCKPINHGMHPTEPQKNLPPTEKNDRKKISITAINTMRSLIFRIETFIVFLGTPRLGNVNSHNMSN